MSRSTYQGRYGDRYRSNWGEGEAEAQYALGDIVYVPPNCAAILDDRLNGESGVYRVHSCFSIGEDASFYYRVSPMEPTGRGDRWKTLWDTCSDRIHVCPGQCDYTAGWALLHSADAKRGAV